MRTTTATTFEVSAVRRATRPLTEVPYKEAVEALLTTGLPAHERQMVEDMARQGLSLVLPEAPPYRPVEACARHHGRLLAEVSFHPVVAAAHRPSRTTARCGSRPMPSGSWSARLSPTTSTPTPRRCGPGWSGTRGGSLSTCGGTIS